MKKRERNMMADCTIIRKALDDAIEKISQEYCSHTSTSQHGADNDHCCAQEQYRALLALERIEKG